MPPVALVACAELRRRRGSLAVLALLTTVVVATVLATLAGARRTTTVLDRFRHETAARDLEVTVSSPEFVLEPARVDELRRGLESVDGVLTVSALTIIPVAVSGTPYDFGIMASPDGGYFRAVDRSIVIDGRLPADAALNEIALNETAAAQLGLGVGDRLTGPTYTPEIVAGFLTDNVTKDEASGPTIAATIVGVVRTAEELSVHPRTQTPGAVASPAFFRSHSATSGFSTAIYALRVDRAADNEDEVRAIVRDAVGRYEAYVSSVGDDYAGELRSTHRSLAAGMMVAVVVAAIAGLLAIALAVNREFTLARGTDVVMRGLGMERRQRALAMAMPSAFGIAIGTVCGALAAAALSPLFPLSVARRAEVAPGFELDAVVLATGGAACLVAMLACVGWGARHATKPRASSGSRPMTVSAVRVVRRAGPPAAVGLTMTLASGAAPRGVPARSAAAGALVGVAGIVGVAVFIASVSAGQAEAYRFGWTWDASPDLVTADPERVVARMVDDRDLDAVADVSCGPLDLEGTQQYACAFNNWKGDTAAPVVAGRRPTEAGDIALGRATMRRLGVELGDTVRSGNGDDLVVVGETVIPMLDNGEPGQGAIMTVDGLEQQRLAEGGRYLLLTYAAGTDHAALERRLEADYGVSFTPYSRPEPPSRLVQLDLMTGLLRALGAFLAALGAVGLVHFLVVSARRRRHDFAVLRALGFARRDVSLTTSWQAVTIVLFGVVVGTPLGMMIGRWAWLSAIGSVGIIDTLSVPRSVLAAVVVVVVGGAAAVGAVPGWVVTASPTSGSAEVGVMGAAWMWVRSEWRRGWGGLLIIGLLIAVAGGVTMAVAAGARRADSAIARLQAATNDPQALVELKTTDLDELPAQVAALPSPAELAERLNDVDGVTGVTVLDFVATRASSDGEWFNGALGAQRGRAPTSLVVDGRLFDVDDPYEVMVNETAAEQWGGVGSVLTVETLDPTQFDVMVGLKTEAPGGPTVRVRVVGVLRGIEEISDFPEPILVATPAFVERYDGEVAMFPGTVQVEADTHRIDQLVADLGAAAGREFDAHLPDEDFAGRIDDSTSVEVTALWVFAVAAGLAGLVVVYQAMSRGGFVPVAERATRRALGFTRRLDVAASIIRSAPAFVLGVVGAVALAILLSPVFPRGIAKRADPTPGLLADRTVLAVGAAVILVGGVALAATSGWAARRRSDDHPTRAGFGRVSGALGPIAGFGLQLAFSGARRGRIGRAGAVAVAIGVAGVLAVTAVERSADRLTSTPRLFGAGWDAVVELDVGQGPEELVRRLEAEPDVVGIGSLEVPGDDLIEAVGPGGAGPVEPEALISWSGTVAPTLTEGRLPVGPGEVAIGATVGEQLGADIGDTVEVHGYGNEVAPFVVVGRVINAGTDELGSGFAVTDGGLQAMTAGCPDDSDDLKCMIITTGIGVSLRHGVDTADAIAQLRRLDAGFIATPAPSVIYNLRQIGATPWFLAAFLMLLGVSGLAHALSTGRRLGRHDVAVTRALGFSPGQTAATMCWQALAVGAVGAVAGVLVGLLAGRLVWRQVAEGTGALVETVVPAWAWVAAPATAVLVALALAIGPALRIAAERPGEILRTE